MNRRIDRKLPLLLIFSLLFTAACGQTEKQISVITREPGSGTREAFDRTVTDGTHFLEERSAEGKKIDRTVKTAIQQTKSGTVLSTVIHDRHAIGYLSLASVSDQVKAVAINGVLPTVESVERGDYPLSRPFVIMTNPDQALTSLATDFLRYLQSDAAQQHCERAGCIFLTDPQKRGGGGEPIPVEAYQPLPAPPSGERILIRGSTSPEQLILSAAKAYAELYGIPPESIFDIQLEGSSVGRRAVEEDQAGNVIGFSSAWEDSAVRCFYIGMDAIAVVVHRENPWVDSLTLKQLYNIYTGEIKSFREIGGDTP